MQVDQDAKAECKIGTASNDEATIAKPYYDPTLGVELEACRNACSMAELSDRLESQDAWVQRRSANVLNFMLPRLERLSITERRVVSARLSDFAEKLCFLALGRQELSITERQMVTGLWKSKVRCIRAMWHLMVPQGHWSG